MGTPIRSSTPHYLDPLSLWAHFAWDTLLADFARKLDFADSKTGETATTKAAEPQERSWSSNAIISNRRSPPKSASLPSTHAREMASSGLPVR